MPTKKSTRAAILSIFLSLRRLVVSAQKILQKNIDKFVFLSVGAFKRYKLEKDKFHLLFGIVTGIVRLVCLGWYIWKRGNLIQLLFVIPIMITYQQTNNGKTPCALFKNKQRYFFITDCVLIEQDDEPNENQKLDCDGTPFAPRIFHNAYIRREISRSIDCPKVFASRRNAGAPCC